MENQEQGIIADDDIDIQTTSLNIPSNFQAENLRDKSQSSILINYSSNILDKFALTEANIFDSFAHKIEHSQSQDIAKIGTELGKRIDTIKE